MKCPFLVIQINDIAVSHIDNSVLPNDIVRGKVAELTKMELEKLKKLKSKKQRKVSEFFV